MNTFNKNMFCTLNIFCITSCWLTSMGRGTVLWSVRDSRDISLSLQGEEIRLLIKKINVPRGSRDCNATLCTFRSKNSEDLKKKGSHGAAPCAINTEPPPAEMQRGGFFCARIKGFVSKNYKNGRCLDVFVEFFVTLRSDQC